MRRLTGPVLALIVAGAVACGGSEPSASPSADRSNPASSSPTAGPDETFTTTTFRPAISFTLGPEWTNPVLEEADVTFLHAGAAATGVVPELNILRVDKVYDPTSGRPVPAPADIIDWLRANSFLTVGASMKVTIAGSAGIQVDVVERVSPTPTDGLLYCDDPPHSCLRLFQQRSGSNLAVARGEQIRFIVFRHAGTTFTIEIDAPSARFPAFMDRVQRLLDTLSFA